MLYLNKKLSIEAEPVPLGTLANNLAALKAGQIDAFLPRRPTLALVDHGDVQLLLALLDIYPNPYAATVIWATEDAIDKTPDLVAAFVETMLQSVKYLQDHPSYASELYVKRTHAPKNRRQVRFVSLDAELTPNGRGTGNDLVASVAGNWQFMTQSGAVSSSIAVNMDDVVDVRFLPSR